MAIAVVTSACGNASVPGDTPALSSSTPDPGVSASPEGSASPGGGAGLGDLAWIFETPAPPVDLALTLDAGKKVEALIPVEGGSVTATGADGTLYTLDVPADALLVETVIGLTPVTKVDGMPFGSETHAVQLSPDGLVLYGPAILTITPAQAIPVGEQIVFGYLAAGKDMILAPPVVDSSDIKIQVLHFSGNGVTRGLLADIEPVRRRLGGDLERRMHDAVAEQLLRARAAAQAGQPAELPDFESAFDAYEEQVVKPRVAAAGESCAAGRLAIETVLGLERQRQLLGLGEGGDPVERYPGLRDSTTRVCVLEEFELCVEDHVIHRMAMVWRSFERQYALQGLPVDTALFREARELTITCLTFKLKLESTGTLDAAEGGYESTVTSEVTLRFDPDEDKISGEAPLENTDFEFKSPCGATSIPGGGTFEVGSLRILTARPDQFNADDLNFLMSYLPGATSESAKIKICGSSGGPLPLPPFPAWTGTFLATHKAELDTDGTHGGGYIAIDWEVFGNEYFAKKEWIKQEGNIIEVGTFKLYHVPGA